MQISLTDKYSIDNNNLKYYQMFGIFLTFIGLIFIIPKINTYYNKHIADKKSNKFMKKSKIEDIFLFAGVLFIAYGIKEIFFRTLTDNEKVTNSLLTNLMNKNVIDKEFFDKMTSNLV